MTAGGGDRTRTRELSVRDRDLTERFAQGSRVLAELGRRP